MSIKVESQGTIPAVTLDHIQYSNVRISVSEVSPYAITLTGKVRVYGNDANGDRVYRSDTLDVSLSNVDQYISGLSTEDQVLATQAMADVQGGLGILAQLVLGITFESYEP